MRDNWSAGDLYEPYVGRWSRVVAARFVDWIGVQPGANWLDVGCGTGALTQTLLDRADARSVAAVDASSEFIDYAAAHIQDRRARFMVGDAQQLTLDAATVDAAVSGLCLNFVPDPARAVAEMRRVTRPGGVVGAYVWDYADGATFIRAFWDAAVAVDPGAAPKHEGNRFPLCRPDPIRELLSDAGLRDVDIAPIDIETAFRDFDDYWEPFTGGQGPAPSYAVSLPEDTRAQLRDRLRATLPMGADGSISLPARAWAVRATVP